MNQPTESYTNRSSDDIFIELEVYGEPNAVNLIGIGGRFESVINLRPAQTRDAKSAIAQAFNFFNNIAPLIEYAELKKGWRLYKRHLAKGETKEALETFWLRFDEDDEALTQSKWSRLLVDSLPSHNPLAI
jgi:hypothetical protein